MAVHDPADHRLQQERVELTPTEARQGVLGRPVLMVLVVGLVLAMLAWAAAEMFGTAIAPQTPVDGQQVTTPVTQPAGENVINNDPAPGDVVQPEPAIVNPQPTGNQ